MIVAEEEWDGIRASVASALGRTGPRLRFAPELERRYEAETRSARSAHLVQSGVLGVILANCFLLTDWNVIPDVFGQSVTLHLFGSMLYLCVILITARNVDPRVREAMHFVCLSAAVLGVIALVSSSHAPDRGYACITYVLMMNFVMLVTRLRFEASLAFYAVVLAAVLHAAMSETAAQGHVEQLMVLSVLIAGCFANYANHAVEAGERRAYLLTLEQRLSAEDLAECNARLTALSSTDWLTGAANRRGLEQHLARVWAQSTLYRRRVALLMIDVDHFKLFNDYHGHPAGDTCLATLSALIARQLRQDHDFLARYGGEEFAVVMPDTSLEEAIQAGERIRQAVQELAMPHDAPGAAPTLTVSIGAQAALPHMSGGPAQLIAGADQALYCSKMAGRNQVYPPPQAHLPCVELRVVQA